MLLSVLRLARRDVAARGIVTGLTAACTRGSYLVISHPASDIDAQETAEATRRLNQSLHMQAALRDRAGVGQLFDGFEFVPPGLVRVTQWRPESGLQAASPAALWAGVARLP
jgi:hypothetical protein